MDWIKATQVIASGLRIQASGHRLRAKNMPASTPRRFEMDRANDCEAQAADLARQAEERAAKQAKRSSANG